MFALARLAFFGFLVLSVLYVGVSIYSRLVRRRKLGKEWDTEIREGDRDAFIRAGLEDYDQSFRRKLILLIYIVPVVVIGLTVYLVNFY
ncbi:hypothetical protein [Thalassobius sp. MITS945101]|uniref:hypothetical protein n=1 Tax=Thalassobius sp. MITS945101 TaxID=3096994 RepID=UPI003999A9FD